MRVTAQTLVAVLNTTQETIELLGDILESEGYAWVSAYIVDFKRGKEDLETFFHTHQPQAVIYDIALPYVDNWQFFQEQVVARNVLPTHRFILTTANKRVLEVLVGPTAAIELVDKPFDIDVILDAVARAVRA